VCGKLRAINFGLSGLSGLLCFGRWRGRAAGAWLHVYSSHTQLDLIEFYNAVTHLSAALLELAMGMIYMMILEALRSPYRYRCSLRVCPCSEESHASGTKQTTSTTPTVMSTILAVVDQNRRGAILSRAAWHCTLRDDCIQIPTTPSLALDLVLMRDRCTGRDTNMHGDDCVCHSSLS
jgi:hypothetical protein